MIRYLICFFLLILLIIATFLMVKVFKIKKSFVCKLVCVCVASVLLIEVFSFFSFEKNFPTFESPQSALSFYGKDYFKNADNVSFVYGDDSCMLYSSSQEAPRFLRHVENGWKFVDADCKSITNLNIKSCAAAVYHIRNTQDYYIKVVDFSKSITNLSDDCNTNFVCYEEEKLNRYIGYLKTIDINYNMTFDGKTVNLGKLYKQEK